MAKRGQDEAERQLGKYFDIFRDAIDVGNRHFWTKFQDDAHRITTICRAGLMRCFIADELKKRLDSKVGVRIAEQSQTTLFFFGADWLLMVHKLDEGCRSAVNLTQTAMDLNNNDLEQAELPGIPRSATVVFLGYIENVGDRFVPEMRLTCPSGDTPAWTIDLGAVPPAPAPVEITPTERPQDPAGGTRVVVRRKGRKANH